MERCCSRRNGRENIPNISTIVQNSWCTGCGTCVAFCPAKALKIKYTPNGKYEPEVIESKCTGCGFCISLCPAANENFNQLNQFVFAQVPSNKLIGRYINCFIGYSNNLSLRWKATSGGIATSLLTFALKSNLIDGALLTRTNKHDPLRAEPFIARTEEEILSAIGSKYVPVALNQLLDRILTENGRFAVVGLPCHIQGIRRAELNVKKLRPKIAYHIGLACSHTISFRGVKFVLGKMGVSADQIDKLQYRGYGWPSGLRVLLNNKQEKFLPNLSSWWSEIFGGHFFSHYYCTLCSDHLAEFADITLADAWLHKFIKNDKIGTSIIVTRTSKGEKLIQAAKSSSQIQLSDINVQDVLNSQIGPLFFKKRNIRARIKLLAITRKKIPANLKENKNNFLRPTFGDYLAVPAIYANIFASKNRTLQKIFNYIPFKVLKPYRKLLKRLLLYRAKTITNKKTVNIVVTNSHADNRGDEAAQRSMITSLRELIPDAKFTVLTNSPTGLQLQNDVDVIKTFSISKKTSLLAFLGIALKLLGINLSLLSRKFDIFRMAKRIVEADVVISAPGGPYFGDLYKKHEIREHLFHIFLAKILRKPVMIYGPSMGPFRLWKRNILRRYLLNKVEIITLRDPISKEYLNELKLTKPLVYVTADSAFQDSVNINKHRLADIMAAEKITSPDNRGSNAGALIGITPTGTRWNYPNSQNPQKEQEKYNKLMAQTIDYLIDTFNATVVFFPQLYGQNSDLPLIDQIIELVEAKEHVKVVSNKWNSQIQQTIISQMDMFIGNRYHSVIFALKGHVPTICLAYEHKSVGVMKAAEMDEYLIDIKELTYETLIDKINRAWSERENITTQLKPQLAIFKRHSFTNSVLAKAFVDCILKNNTQKEQLQAEIDTFIHRLERE